MSTYKLYSFDKIDPGEIIRYVFLQAGQKFDDVRIGRDEWPKLKDQMPWGELPVLEVDGNKLPDTLVIAAYLGNKLGLAGSGDAWDRAQLDSICQLVVETTIVLSRYWSETDPSLREKKKAEVLKTAVPQRLKRINKYIEDNGSPEGFVKGNQLTYADFFIHFLFCDVLTHVYPDQEQQQEASKYPAVGRLCKMVHNQPNIKKYLDSRPTSNVVWL